MFILRDLHLQKIFIKFLELLRLEQNVHTVNVILYEIIVVAQYYDTDVNKEYAIRGNSAILKCVVPSFVADFVKVLSWHTDQGEEFVPGDDFGINRIRISVTLESVNYRSPYLLASRKFHRCIFDIQWSILT